MGGVFFSEIVYDDNQITHTVCVDKQNRLSFWSNSGFFEELLDSCELAFQGGPMIYTSRDGVVEQNLEPRTYM